MGHAVALWITQKHVCSMISFIQYLLKVRIIPNPLTFAIQTTLFMTSIICPAEIFKTLISLDPNKASGIANVGPRILKICAFPLSDPICHLFQQSISQSYLPQEWHTHCVIPIYKSGDKSLVSNYRPVSLLCCISKVLEKIIFKVTYNFLINTFSQHQFGFLPGR